MTEEIKTDVTGAGSSTGSHRRVDKYKGFGFDACKTQSIVKRQKRKKNYRP